MDSLRRALRTAARGVFTSSRAKWQTAVFLLVAATLLLGVPGLLHRYAPWLTDEAAIRVALQRYGTLAPVVFVLLQATQVVVAPIPGQVLGLVSGYLFGTLPGTLYSLLGATIGSALVFWLSRRFGRAYVERVVDPALVERFDDLTGRHGLLALLVVFLLPGLPDDAVCFAAGLTDIRIRTLVAVSVVGRLPGYLLVNAVGAQFAARHLATVAVVLAALAVLAVVGYVWREELVARLLDAP